MKELQQSSSLRPFMRKPGFLFVVARGASQHDIVDIMAWPPLRTAYGNRVVKLEDGLSITLHKLCKAVITSVFLCFQLALYLFRSQLARDRLTDSLSFLVGQIIFKGSIAAICSLMGIALLLMGLMIHSGAGVIPFLMSLMIASFVCDKAITVSLAICLIIGTSLLFVCRTPYFILSRFFSLLVRTRRSLLFLYTSAFFARGMKTYFPFVSSIAMKKLRSSGKPTLTGAGALSLRGILGYDAIHGKNQPFLSSARGCCKRRSGTTLLLFNFTAIPPLVQHQEACL